ncbi:MAG TPA: hypothetical protein VKY74_02285 [Chloroflexia bacterium]|nr:hypothetical protein [Chloroflexia bacterium]
MRRVFSYVFFLLGLFVMVMSILAIFGLIALPLGDNLWLLVGMAGFGLILCLIAFFMLAPEGGSNPDEVA